MDSNVIDKIRKLLRLGKSSNPNEAALAIARAFELARKHAIDLESVNLDDEAIECFLSRIGARLSFEQKLILNLVKRFFRVDIIADLPNIAYIGRETDISIAQYVYDYLLRALRGGLRVYQAEVRRKLSRTRKQNFIQGWIYGVAFKLEAAAKQLAVEDSRFAMVKVEEDPRVRAAAKQFYPRTRPVKTKLHRKDLSAMEVGWRNGKNVDIHQPLAGPERLALT
jgi:hypothetical protein